MIITIILRSRISVVTLSCTSLIQPPLDYSNSCVKPHHVSCNCLEVAPESVFSDPTPPSPHPLAVSGCVWFVVLDSCPEDYSLPENKAPQCVLCFPHSLALTSAVWQEGGGHQRLCAVRDPSLPTPTSTLTQQSGWRTLAEWGAPPAISYRHKHPPLRPKQSNQRHALHSTCCFAA